MKEALQDEMISLSECLHGLCALGINDNLIPLAPAKTNEELVKVIDSS